MKIQSAKTLKIGVGVAVAALLGGTVSLACAKKTASVGEESATAVSTAVAADDWGAEKEKGRKNNAVRTQGRERCFR